MSSIHNLTCFRKKKHFIVPSNEIELNTYDVQNCAVDNTGFNNDEDNITEKAIADDTCSNEDKETQI